LGKAKGRRCKKPNNGQESVLYTIDVILRMAMEGADLVLTYHWRGTRQRRKKGRQQRYVGGMELARSVISMATSLEIEEVDIQYDDGMEPRENN
jgi:hypothetical protein